MKRKILWMAALVILASGNTLAQEHRGLLPHFMAVQYAGSIGYFSTGFGYNLMNDKARISTHFGFVPPKRGGALSVLSVKLFFKPASYTVWNRVKFHPFDLGLMASYHFGGGLINQWDESRYPKNYYWWSPSLKLHLGMESALTYEFKEDHRFRAVTGYIEFNTNELYLISFLQNVNSLSFGDIIKIGTGARLHF